MNTLKYFKLDMIWAPIAIIFAYWFGGRDLAIIVSTVVLAILEISLSFDNAVLNAKKLETMSHGWQMMFLTFGMIIAVGVVRFYIPLQLVATLSGVSLYEAFDMAMTNHAQFQHIIAQSHSMVAGFGAGFLGMLTITFFIDSEREDLWVRYIEKPLQFIGTLGHEKLLATAIMILIAVLIRSLTGSTHIGLCIIAGVVVFHIVEAVKTGLEKLDESESTGGVGKFLAGGFGTFIFLEVLDASMSLDGVVAALSISGDIVAVVAGLSIGALAVRSLTIKLVREKTLGGLVYIETGAFYSIALVTICMLVGMFVEIPEWFTGAFSALFIVVAALCSLKVKSKEGLENA